MTIPTPADAPLTLVDVRDWLAEYYPDTDVLRTVEAALGTGGICRCGMARSYHGPNPPDLADHEWEPRYLSPQPEVSVTPGLREAADAVVQEVCALGDFALPMRAMRRVAMLRAALAESPVTPGGRGMSRTPEREHVHYTNDAAGRVFHEHSYSDNHPTHYTQAHPEAKREAVAAYLASPEAVEDMVRALHDHGKAFMAEPESFGRPEDVAAAILAALRDQRGAS